MISQNPPLAHRMRPSAADEIVGQADARTFLDDFARGKRRSVILWGPPGSGKTSVATIIAGICPDAFFPVSAVTSGIQDIRRVTAKARAMPSPPVIFVDEIHRFTRVQQDALLPFVEKGQVVLVGATTENPSFTVTSPLISRVAVIVLQPLGSDEIDTILARALEGDEILAGLGRSMTVECRLAIARAADGDARAALNLLEFALTSIDKDPIELADVEKLLDRPLYHDRTGDAHYDLISAYHKSLRASDVEAGIYWLARMLEAGEDRLYILRRMIRIASEDIGLAEPHAVRVVLAARDAFTALGSPEGDLGLYQATVYLACAPKSNAVYLAEKNAKKLIRQTGTPPVPMSLRNAPTRLMRELGFGQGYVYAHDDPQGALHMRYLPEGLPERPLYTPTDKGFEKRIKEVMHARSKAQGYPPGTPRGSGRK